MRRSVKPILAINGMCGILGMAGAFLWHDFLTLFFLSILLVTGFALMGAGVEDISMTPTGTAIRRALLRSGPPYSPQRHKEAQETANVFIVVGGILFAETVGIGLLVAFTGI